MAETVRELIEAGNAEELKDYLLAGKATSAKEEEKATWVRLAAGLGKADILRLLCEGCHGVGFHPDSEGRTLMHFAAQSGDAETMRYTLQTLGFAPDEGDRYGVTPLEMAKMQGEEALRALEAFSGMRLDECYRNPIFRGFRPDPSVLRVGEDYYLINSSFVMLPALPISHSRDLVHWETISHVFTSPDTAALRGLPGGFGYWAPDISWYQGRYWVVATLRRDTAPFRLQMITSAPDPRGPWDPPKFLEVDGIDPSLFTDTDGKRYLVVNPGVQIARISDEGDLLESPHMIYLGSNRRKSEGPHLFKKDGWYYTFQAEGGTGSGHMITCARSRTLEGPYVPCPFNPVLGPRRDDAYIGRGGHGKPVQLPDGRWAVLYLCGRRVEGKSLMGRETALDEMTWTADGWPMINGLKGPSCLHPKLLPDMPVNETPPWACPREDYADFASFDTGAIRLRAGKALSEKQGAHLLLHRQSESGVWQSVRVDVTEMAIGSVAGLSGYYDENSWYLFGLRRKEEGSDLVFIEHVGESHTEQVLGCLDSLQATLSISGKDLDREAACDAAGARHAFRIVYLTDEGLSMGKRFTGAMLGLAAMGEGEAVLRNYEEVMNHA
ncbi:MAG: family 43 glycosylhydrolase [Clostridia bacterium]|nr:family 43 glycosylhydrolase [Clostridia bacterium]